MLNKPAAGPILPILCIPVWRNLLVTRDLESVAGEAAMKQLVKRNRMPFVTLSTRGMKGSGRNQKITILLVNNTGVPVLDAAMSDVSHAMLETRVGDIPPRGRTERDFPVQGEASFLRELRLDYTVAEGFRIRDEGQSFL